MKQVHLVATLIIGSILPGLGLTGRAAAQEPEAGQRIHSVTDIAHEFSFYFDGRFASNYLAPQGGVDWRNWATLHKYDLTHANLLILQSGASPCPYLPEDIEAVRSFLEEGGGVAVIGDYAVFRDEDEYGLNALARAFGAQFLEQAAAEPLKASADLRVEAVKTYGGRTLGLERPDEWQVLVEDAEGRAVMARRAVGKGNILLASRALSGRRPDATDPINAQIWQPVLRDLCRGKVVHPDRHPEHMMPEITSEREGLAIRHTQYMQPYSDVIFDLFRQCRPAIERIMGVPPHEGMLTSMILLPTGAGGFSSGRTIGLGVWWGDFPRKQYGMVELLGHESTHSWVLPFPEPMWNEGIATYVGILLGRELGLNEEADATLRGWIERARKHDPDMTKFDLAGGDVPHVVRMAKPMWIWDQLRSENPEILATYFRTKRRVIDPNERTEYTADDCVAVLSLAMGRDLFPWFRSLGTNVERSRTTVPEQEAHWRLVPMRTAEQKAQGMAGGEMGQMAFTLAVCAQDPNLMAMGIDTAGAYVSEDGGRNWESRRRGIRSNGVQSIAFDPANSSVLWAAGLASKAGTKRAFPPDAKYFDNKADGIYRSEDLGRNWKLIRSAAFLRGHAQNQYFAFDPEGSDAGGCRTVYALTHDAGLLKTEDAGETWASIGPEGIIGNAILRHAGTGRLWLAADRGLWRSDDGGEAWAAVAPPEAQVRGLAVRPDDHDTVYIAAGKGGVWRTNDAGSTWQRLSNGLPEEINWTRLAISPADPDVLYVDATAWGGPVPYYSHDGGENWHPMESREAGFYGAGIYWAEGLAAHPTEPKVAYHLHPPRMTTDGGRTWQSLGSGVSGSRRGARTAIAFRPDDPLKMAFFYTDHGCALTEDGGDTWAYVSAPRQADLGAKTMPAGAYDPTPGSRTMVSAVGGWTKQRLCITHDDGATWRVHQDMVDNYVFFAWHPQDPKVVYVGADGGGLRSDDGGETWKPIARPIRAMSRSNGDTIYAVTHPERSRSRVERSTDRGETWHALGDDIPHGVAEIDVDPRDPDRVYATPAYAGIWVFDGQEWSARGEEDGLERDFFGAFMFRKIVVDPRRPDVIYAGQNHCWRGAGGGIFRSTDRGLTWRNITGNLGPDLTVWSIAVSPHDSTVWVGTDLGNWRLPPPEAD